MTELETATLVPPADAPADAARGAAGADAPAVREVLPKPFARRVLGLTFGRLGARLGVAWIGVMGLLAVFAPALANSHPILLKQGGHWSSPLLRYLIPADVVLQVTFWAFIVLCFIRRWTV